MLNRKYTEALEKLAKAKARSAAAEEKSNDVFLKQFFALEKTSSSSNHTPRAGSSVEPVKPLPKK
jgi:hypothetical protein